MSTSGPMEMMDTSLLRLWKQYYKDDEVQKTNEWDSGNDRMHEGWSSL